MTDSAPPLPAWRWPAEWEPHQATWLSWPHNPTTWPGRRTHIQKLVARLAALLSQSETVHINIPTPSTIESVRALLDAASAHNTVQLHILPTDDVWCRDYGATFVTTTADTPTLRALNWEYNGWGGKFPYNHDNQVAAYMAAALGVPAVEGALVLEGGAIEGNGAGLLLTTTPCLLDPNRNPNWSRAQITDHLRATLGVAHVIWLPGGLIGDDTDGHIDMLTRFVAPDTVVTTLTNDPTDPNYAMLHKNLAHLQATQTIDGHPLQIIPLPLPPPLYKQHQRLPASYANFYIANSIILVPQYGVATDQQAFDILQSCFPERTAVGLDCRDLIIEGGALHCLTQQVPALALTSTP